MLTVLFRVASLVAFPKMKMYAVFASQNELFRLLRVNMRARARPEIGMN